MSDRLASRSDEEGQAFVGTVLAPVHLRIAVNEHRNPSPNRRRHRQGSRSRVGGQSEALGGVGMSPPTVSARSSDGALTFALCPRPHGVVVQRSELRRGGRPVVQSILFTNARAFMTWCESDHLRFDYPLLFIDLARCARDLFDSAA